MKVVFAAFQTEDGPAEAQSWERTSRREWGVLRWSVWGEEADDPVEGGM
jgi:hypothetical protein